jgi:hypothetical protein
MHALRWQPTLNLQARAALTALHVASCAARQRFYSQPTVDGDYTDQPRTQRPYKRNSTRFVKRSMEVRGRNGIKFRQSSSPLATNTLGKQAEVLILSDPGKSDRSPEGGLDGRAVVDIAADDITDASRQLETARTLADSSGSQAQATERVTDSKTILDTLANEESSSQNDSTVAEQIESSRPQSLQEADRPMVSKRAFKKISASLMKSFTTQQLRTYHSNYLKALHKDLKTSPDSEKEFWGEKWDPADVESDNPPGHSHPNYKSNIVESIIKSLWKVEVKSEAVEVGSVNGTISEFNFSLLSSGGTLFPAPASSINMHSTAQA